MTYNEMWRMLTPLYEPNEAKSIVRMVFEMRFGLSFTDILCGKDTQISEEERADLQKIVERLFYIKPILRLMCFKWVAVCLFLALKQMTCSYG